MGISEERKGTLKDYRDSNRERIYFQNAEFRDKLRLEMVEAYGGKCLHCGETDPIVLTLDHINDDPDPEYEWCGKSARGGYNLYRKLRKEGWPKDRFQLLCFNCNMRKEHKRRRDGMIERMGPSPEIGPTISRGEARAKAGPNTNNRSGFKGIIWLPKRERWQAQIRVEGKFIYVGKFVDIRDAAKAYREAQKKYWGEFAEVLTDEEIEEMANKKKHATPRKATKSLEEMGL